MVAVVAIVAVTPLAPVPLFRCMHHQYLQAAEKMRAIAAACKPHHRDRAKGNTAGVETMIEAAALTNDQGPRMTTLSARAITATREGSMRLAVSIPVISAARATATAAIALLPLGRISYGTREWMALMSMLRATLPPLPLPPLLPSQEASAMLIPVAL
jgi:hypothetical protein